MKTEPSMTMLAAALAVLLAGPALEDATAVVAHGHTIGATLDLPGCVTDADSTTDWRPTLVGPDRLVHARIECADAVAEATIGQFIEPEQGREAVSDLHELTPRDVRFNGVMRQPEQVEFQVTEHVNASKPDSVQLIWSWYSVGDQPTASAYAAKRMQLFDALRLTRRDASVFVLAASGRNADSARRSLDQVIGPLWSWYLDEHRVP